MATGSAPELQGIAPDGAAQPVQGIDPFLFPDERSDKENMENQSDFLKERMESEFGLLDKLLKIKSLSVIEISEIKSKATTFKRNGKLLELIFGKNNHQDLIRALTETSQMHLVNWIRANGEYRIEFHLEWPLREKEIGILNDNQEVWTDNLDACGLLSLLFSKKVINKRQMDFVQSKQTSYERNEELLTILRRCSLATYLTTIDCLRASNQDHIADILDGKGAVVQVHANLDGERLDEIETQIVRGMASLILNVPENRTNLLLQELQIRILAARRGSSIVLYIYCKTMDELTYLCEVINNNELKDRIEKLFNSLLRDMVTKVIDLYIVEAEINKAKKCFEREVSQDKFDEDISRLRAQKQHDPAQARKSGEVSSEEDEGSLSKNQPTVISEKEESERMPGEASRYKFDEDISRLRAQKRRLLAKLFWHGDDPVQARTLGDVSSKEAEKKPVESVGGDDDDDDDDDEESDDDRGYVRDAGFFEVHATGFFMKEKKLQAEEISRSRLRRLRLRLRRLHLKAHEGEHDELLTRMDIIAAILRNNTDYLTEYMRPEGLVDKLHAAECLTDEDTRYIKTLKHRTEKNDEILSAINDGNKYDDLISCLRQTRQYVAADVVEKGGVALKINVTFMKASLPDVEKRLVEIIGTLHDKSVPKADHVMQYLSQLRRGSIEILDAQYDNGIVIWLWCRSEGALRNVCAIYRSKQLNKLLLEFFDLLMNRQMPLPVAVRTDIEDTDMEFAAWPIKLVQKQLLPVVEGVVCSTAVLPHTLFVLCQNPTEVLVFENKDYSKPSKRIALKDLTDPVDIVASHQAACLYVTDAASSSVWKVTTNDGKVAQWLQNVGDPYTLSLTTGEEVIMVRRGSPSTLEIYGPDGKKLHDIKLPPNISLPNHAVETLTGSFFVSNGKENAKFTGVFEIDKGGNTIGYLDFGYEPIIHLSEEVNSILRNFCTDTQLGYPRYLTLGKQNQLMSTDFQNGGVMVFDRQLCLEQIVGKDDVKQTLHLCWKEEDNQLVIIHGEKRVIGIYEFSSDVTQ